MSPNHRVLASIVAACAIDKAKRAHLPTPVAGVMDALEEAIEERRIDMARLALQGRVDSTEYRRAQEQLIRWDAAWRRNRSRKETARECDDNRSDQHEADI